MYTRALTFALVLSIASSACTTLKPSDGSPEELQRLILSGELLKPGDHVRLETAAGNVFEFQVTDVRPGQGLILGTTERVAITDVVAVESRGVSVTRTALLLGGVGYMVVAIILISLAPAMILGLA